MRGYVHWDGVIKKLNESKRGRVSVDMGSIGSAYSTATRLRQRYNGMRVAVRGNKILLSLVA